MLDAMNPFSLFSLACRRVLRGCLPLALLGLAAPAVVHAYTLEGPRWPSNGQVVMYVQLGTPAGTLTDGSKSWNAVAESALAIWNPCLGSGVQFAVGASTISNVQGDHKNSVFFSNSAFGSGFGDDTLAITVYTSNSAGTQFTEADVVVNNANTFDSYRGPFDTGQPYDLRRVLVHEFGHVLGLGHAAQGTVAIMEPVISEIDTIEADDIAGVESIYGSVGGTRPAITSSLNITAGAANMPFQYQILASNSPISYYATGLPSGMSINTSTGVISGTGPYNATTADVTLTATNAAGSATATLVITFVGPPTITSAARIGVQPGKPFTYQITATNSPTSYAAFNNFTSPLPAGVTVNTTTGLVSGVVPNGFQYLNVEATNAGGTGSQVVTLDPTYVPPTITGVTNLNQLVPANYTYTGTPCVFNVSATGNWYNFSASGLPAGLSISSLGSIYGTPTTPGIYPVTLTVVGTYGTSTSAWTLEVGGQPIALTSGTIAGLVGVPLTYQITGSPAPTGFQFAYSFGHEGLNLDPVTGVISGTPPSAVAGTVIVFLSDGADGAMVDIPINISAGYVSPFFTGEVPISNVYYLQFPNGSIFGYYAYLSDRHYIYHFDLGYEYIFDANDGQSGVYFYDFTSKGFFYTSPNFPFPYLYDFNLNSVVYYYPDPNNAGHYNTNGIRYFYVFSTGQIISK